MNPFALIPLTALMLWFGARARASIDPTYDILSRAGVLHAGPSQVGGVLEYADLTLSGEAGQSSALAWALFWRARGFDVLLPRRWSTGGFQTGDVALVCRAGDAGAIVSGTQYMLWDR